MNMHNYHYYNPRVPTQEEIDMLHAQPETPTAENTPTDLLSGKQAAMVQIAENHGMGWHTSPGRSGIFLEVSMRHGNGDLSVDYVTSIYCFNKPQLMVALGY
tara:strand:- start:495 stop:800 length:306 start_codon:yes stop_codon:yes gene_type:complete